MTINLADIYDQYRKADLTGRLNIYLQFSELRNEFLEIDQKEKQQFFLKPPNQATSLNRISRWIRGKFSFLW